MQTLGADSSTHKRNSMLLLCFFFLPYKQRCIFFCSYCMAYVLTTVHISSFHFKEGSFCFCVFFFLKKSHMTRPEAGPEMDH